MKLHAKLLLGFGSLWVVLGVATCVVLVLLKERSASLEDAFHTNFDSVDYCSRMTIALDGFNQLALISIWTHTDMPREALDKLRSDFRVGAEGQVRNITLSGESELTGAALKRGEEFLTDLSGFSREGDGDRAAYYRESLFPKYLAARDSVKAVTELNFNHLRGVKEDLQRNLFEARAVQIAFAIIGAGSAIVSVLVLRKTILGPLRMLTESARQVEAGNLNSTVPVRSADELGELAAAFNAMAARLQEYRQLDHARLLRTQQTTQLAIDSLPDAVAVLNPQGLVEISNTQAQKHFGLTAEGKEPPPQWIRELAAGPLATGRPVEPQGYQSAVQLFDNGVERFLLPRAVPMFGEGGAIIGVVVTLVDVTRLRRADEIKSCLVSTVSHELKTPLAAARFSAHLLAEESVGPLDERQRRLVKAACEGTDRLHRIIEDLLQFQRFDEGRQSVQVRASQAGDMIGRAVDEWAKELAMKRITVAVQTEGETSEVMADPDLVNHVLGNLLSNAYKFVSAGGHVWISTAQDGQWVEVRVTDDGPGIPVEHQEKLFSRFYRAAAPAETSGAGLGLSIARQLIEAQGGVISYFSRPGGGAGFAVKLRRCSPV